MLMNYIKAKRRVFTGRVTRIDEVDLDFRNGNKPTFEVVSFDTLTGVSALPVEGKDVLLIKHFQTGLGKEALSLPTGGLNPGEDPKQRMQIELQEELGYKAGRLTLMARAHAMPGYIGTEPGYLYLAQDLVKSKLPGDEAYPIEVCRMSLEIALDKVKTGEIVDARTMLALLYYERWYR